MSDQFSGFPQAGLDFLRGLAADNSKTYFDAHRSTYDKDLMEPAKAFVVAVGDELRRRVSPGIHAEPKVNGSIFRINRDTRFSKDKTPYKTGLDLIFWEGPGRSREMPGFYFRLAPADEAVYWGAGMHGFPKDALGPYRDAVADDKSGTALVNAIDAVERTGATVGGADGWKRVPKGYDAESPRADLLRHNGLFAGTDEPIPGEARSAAFAPWLAERLAPLAPIHRWLLDNVADA